MKISLRKANALQTALVETIAALDLSNEISINEFEKPTVKIAEAKARFEANLETRRQLQNAIYDIRRKVANANAIAGINNLLADVALVEKEIAFFGKLAKVSPALENDVIVGKLGKIKGRGEDQYYGREDVVRTSIFDEAQIDEYKTTVADYKKRKVSLQDSLLELNVATEIELSADTVDALVDAKII
jgi:hypothetical protein